MQACYHGESQVGVTRSPAFRGRLISGDTPASPARGTDWSPCPHAGTGPRSSRVLPGLASRSGPAEGWAPTEAAGRRARADPEGCVVRCEVACDPTRALPKVWGDLGWVARGTPSLKDIAWKGFLDRLSQMRHFQAGGPRRVCFPLALRGDQGLLSRGRPAGTAATFAATLPLPAPAWTSRPRALHVAMSGDL